jgi:hypothetical protein
MMKWGRKGSRQRLSPGVRQTALPSSSIKRRLAPNIAPPGIAS